MKKSRPINWKKYLLVLVMTLGIFVTAFTLSNFLNQRKLAELQTIQDKIATDILSSETEFNLLEESACASTPSSGLADDIRQLADKISYTESSVSNADEEIITLKKQYSILQIKDYILSKRIGEKCNQKLSTIFYFYSTKDKCPDCLRQSYVLDAIRTDFPHVRVYSFDYHLDLSVIRALRNIYGVADELPAVVVDGTTFNGFQSYDAIALIVPPAPLGASQNTTVVTP